MIDLWQLCTLHNFQENNNFLKVSQGFINLQPLFFQLGQQAGVFICRTNEY